MPLTSTASPDFLVSVGYKWLLGPFGLTFLYVAERYEMASRVRRTGSRAPL